MEFISSKQVDMVLEDYPPNAQDKLRQLRQLIIDTAKETEGVEKLLETTKWNEPSYVTRSGSTVRMDWKPKSPGKYYLYFICSTELVSSFRFLFGGELSFEGNRAIVLDLKEVMPVQSLKKCIQLALTYHKIKHLPMLGV